jgi:hypothetical protein
LNDKREFFKLSVNAVLEILESALPDIEWTTGESYELIKKDFWLLDYTKQLKQLESDVNEFEKYAISQKWFPDKNNWEADIWNKMDFSVTIKKRLDTLVNGLQRRPEAVINKLKYLKDDDKWSRKEIKDLQRTFDDYKNKHTTH